MEEPPSAAGATIPEALSHFLVRCPGMAGDPMAGCRGPPREDRAMAAFDRTAFAARRRVLDRSVRRDAAASGAQWSRSVLEIAAARHLAGYVPVAGGVAGGVVSSFQDTINRVVILAAFLPVLAGQSGNTGCQALAVTIRGMTLSELKEGSVGKLLFKEGLLGLFNGICVGLSAAVGMYLLANSQSHPQALSLSVIVFAAMIGSCFVSGLFGALIPLTLKRIGADPATASSIFLTTATDVASMGLLLSLATAFLL